MKVLVNGKTYNSLKEACDILDLNYNSVRSARSQAKGRVITVKGSKKYRIEVKK